LALVEVAVSQLELSLNFANLVQSLVINLIQNIGAKLEQFWLRSQVLANQNGAAGTHTRLLSGVLLRLESALYT